MGYKNVSKMFLSKNSYTLIIFIACFIGLFYHIEQVSENYFTFTTDSKTTVTKHTIITVPSVSACFPKLELLKMDKLNTMMNLSFGSSTSLDDWAMNLGKTESLTVRDYFDITPKENEVGI